MSPQSRRLKGRKPGKFTRLVGGVQETLPGFIRQNYFVEAEISDALYMLARKETRTGTETVTASDIVNRVMRAYLKKRGAL